MHSISCSQKCSGNFVIIRFLLVRVVVKTWNNSFLISLCIGQSRSQIQQLFTEKQKQKISYSYEIILRWIYKLCSYLWVFIFSAFSPLHKYPHSKISPRAKYESLKFLRDQQQMFFLCFRKHVFPSTWRWKNSSTMKISHVFLKTFSPQHSLYDQDAIRLRRVII